MVRTWDLWADLWAEPVHFLVHVLTCSAKLPLPTAVFSRLEGKGLKPDTARTYIQAVGGIRCAGAHGERAGW